MGKGKRNREQRTNIWAVHRGGGGGAVPRSALLDVDDVTATTLGAEGLADLEANLWPVDCQSCGRGLGSTRPSVFVFDMLTHASASLHHRQCRRPEWSTSHLLPGSADPHLSWTAQSFLLPVTAGERRDDRPLLVVNPSLEQVGLRRGDDGRWAVSTVEFFRRLGLRTPGRDFVIDRPIPDVTARYDATGTITVGFDDYPSAWSSVASGPVGDRIQELEGVTLCLTTAANPHHINHIDQLLALIESRQITMGWIPLEGAKPTPLPEQPAPDALTSYVLHYNSAHATIGELLATAEADLDPDQAQDWADEILKTHHGVDPATTIGWKPVSNDPTAHYTMDALSAGQFFVRRHPDGWALLRVLSRIDGGAATTDAGVRNWAESAVRIHDNARILDWVPGPATVGFTTLHGSAVER